MAKEALAETKEQPNDYEMVLVMSPEIAGDKIDAAIDNISRAITAKGGTVASVDKWGKRKLAYPIKHFVEGNYVIAKFKMKPASGKELEADLQISENVLRHLLIKLDS